MAALAIVPVFVCAWFFGLRAGLVAGLLSFPLNTLLLNLVGYQPGGWDVIIREGGGYGSVAIVIAGVIVGRLRDLRERLKRELIERERMEEILRWSEERYRQLVENANDIIYRTDGRGHFIFANPVAIRFMRYPAEKIIGKHYLDLIRLDYRKEAKRFYIKQYMKKIPSTYYEFPAFTRDEAEMWIGQNVQLVMEDKQIVGFQAVARDITDRKRAEEALRRAHDDLEIRVEERTQELGKTNEALKVSLKEKDVLLKEIHHRVKNNLQIISSLLKFQSRNIKDKGVLEMFKEGQKRVKSMALVHEEMYGSQNLAQIDFGKYIQNLINYLFRSYGVNPRAIALKINVDDVSLNIDTAIPCGLIIHELVSNSLKYAFPEGREGEIGIDLSKVNESQLTLMVGDNGVGFPKDLDYKNTQTLGLKLVNMLVRQLKASIKLDESGGTTFEISSIKRKERGLEDGKSTDLSC